MSSAVATGRSMKGREMFIGLLRRAGLPHRPLRRRTRRPAPATGALRQARR